MFRRSISSLRNFVTYKQSSFNHVLKITESTSHSIKAFQNLHCHLNRSAALVQCLHTTSSCMDLKEFFDDEKHWNSQEVKSGRPWKLEELRIKSNSDLHKLWYVLLKERNMLLTMQHECEKSAELFPSPERIDKVEESMKNLENVVRERNRAYYELEVGWDGEQPCEKVENVLGMEENYYLREHVESREAHSDLPQFNHWDPQHVVEFKKKLNEQKKYKEFKTIRRQYYEIRNLLKEFPHLTNEVLQEKYPDVDVARFRKNNLEV